MALSAAVDLHLPALTDPMFSRPVKSARRSALRPVVTPADAAAARARIQALTLEANKRLAGDVLRKLANVVVPPAALEHVPPVMSAEHALPAYASLLMGSSTPIYPLEVEAIVDWVGSFLPHNAESFEKVYGAVEGAILWSTFQERLAEARGRPFTPADETRF